MSLNINANDVLELIKTRHSTRKFKDQPVEAEKLDMIIEAGRFAPSGGDNQSASIIVITNRQILDALEKIVEEEFSKMEITVGMYKSVRQSIAKSKRGGYIYDYSAPALIVITNDRNYPNGMADSVCMLENMALMANALDLGSCYINQLHWLSPNEVVHQCMRDLNMPETDEVYCALVVGYADRDDNLPLRRIVPRHGNFVYEVK